MNILFICTANISRSFLAEMLFNYEAEAAKMTNVRSASAGLFSFPGRPADPMMVEYLSERGIPIKEHESRQMTVEDVAWADMILVMEKEHVRLIEESWPEASEKVELLGKFGSEEEIADDVIDPYRRTPYHYRLTQSHISLAVNALIEYLQKMKTREPNVENQTHRG
jgi:protein-tyrosine phosphatase